MASAGTVTVDFAAETAKFTAELKKVNASLKGLEGSFGSIGKLARNFLPIASVGALVSLAKNSINAALAMDDMAERAGIATSSFSRLAFAAEQTDLSVESLAKGVKEFQKTFSEANAGSKNALALFKEIGVSVEQLKQLNPEEQIAAIADGFSKNVAPIDRTRVAIDLFKKSGQEWVPLLSRGAAGVRELTAAAVALDDKAIKALDRGDKALSRLGDKISKKFANLAGQVAIGIVGFTDRAEELEFHIDNLQVQLNDLVESRKDDIFTRITLENGLKRLATYREELKLLKQRKELLTPQEKDPLAEFTQAQIDSFRALGDEGIQVRSDRRRVAGSPENFDQLQQDFDEQALEELNQIQLEATRQFLADSAALQQQGGQDLNNQINAQHEEEFRIKQFWRDYDQEQHQAYLDAKVKLEQGAIDAGIGLLRTFAGQSRNAAIALIALEKGLAIARAVQNTAVGVTAVFADPTIPAYAKPAFAAKIKALGAVQIGLIAATGLGQAAQVGSGGASLGSAANPVFTQSGSTDFSNTAENDAASSQRTVQVILNGNVYNTDDFRASVADALKELDDIDTVIFQSGGAQAQVIRNA